VSATDQRPSVPANVDAAVRCALAKLPADRFTSAQEFVMALGDPGFRHGEIAVTGAGVAAGPWSRLALAGWSVATVLTLTLGWSFFGESGPVRHTLRYTIPLPKEGESEGLYFHYHLSPDGQYVAVDGVTEQAGGIFVRALNSLEWRHLSGTQTGDFFWSSDSRSLAFSDGQKLRRVGVGGGAVQDIADLDSGTRAEPGVETTSSSSTEGVLSSVYRRVAENHSLSRGSSLASGTDTPTSCRTGSISYTRVRAARAPVFMWPPSTILLVCCCCQTLPAPFSRRG
ncbi:MAG: hypothetical protein IIC36_15485, partial [Gemmatimonadetes bacterium]|nr:hypothetical protein [Gemmatimonadota bacterium]